MDCIRRSTPTRAPTPPTPLFSPPTSPALGGQLLLLDGTTQRAAQRGPQRLKIDGAKSEEGEGGGVAALHAEHATLGGARPRQALDLCRPGRQAGRPTGMAGEAGSERKGVGAMREAGVAEARVQTNTCPMFAQLKCHIGAAVCVYMLHNTSPLALRQPKGSTTTACVCAERTIGRHLDRPAAA